MKKVLLYIIITFLSVQLFAQTDTSFSRPWVFWYWMQGAVSKEGITADLQAMKASGIGGAYLMPIQSPGEKPLVDTPTIQLSPRWWQMVNFAFKEAKRLGLQIGMHYSDGFALGGGPWIKPEMSMQKIVSVDTIVEGNAAFNAILPKPQYNENYYHDIKILAYPTPHDADISTRSTVPVVTTNIEGANAQLLVKRGNKEGVKSDKPCWIQYSFQQPFTCRSILITTGGNNYQSHRLKIEVSDDGTNFRFVTQLTPPRHGWQDTDAPVTHVIEPVTAKYFRFTYDKEGTEPGSEDLDAAKWKPVLKLNGLELFGKPQINQYEGKTGEVWRISLPTTSQQVSDAMCVQLSSIVDLSKFVDADGRLQWKVPAGKWTILRIGHTSTEHTNATGGGGKGLECDKFNVDAIKLQFDNWFGAVYKNTDQGLAQQVLKVFHVDSWECGSQNWSSNFAAEFAKRRGYDMMRYLPVMTGVPVESADVSERFLRDVRQTIVDLIGDKFYATLAKLSHEKGCLFTAESVAPTMTSDGMLHYKYVDIPMGEFWLRSPTHDKPNDMLDAISAAHIYKKRIIQAEGFTELRMAWDEHPAMLKSLLDRNYALGINRMVYHVFAHNPWLDRKPGMTLNSVGLYFQRDQTWWKPGAAWVEYAIRCQKLLQRGVPVADVAVFTGEEIPRRSILPERLIYTLPGVMGKDEFEREEKRLQNVGVPVKEMPASVWSTNISEPKDWVNPLNGYAYDCINVDALLTAEVKNGRIALPGGAIYRVLVIPSKHPMLTDGTIMSLPVAKHILQLVKQGANILLPDGLKETTGLASSKDDAVLKSILDEIRSTGKERVAEVPYLKSDFENFGLQRDVIFTDNRNSPIKNIAYTHRVDGSTDIYFISNQGDKPVSVNASLRVSGGVAEIYDAVTNRTLSAKNWKVANGRTLLPLGLEASGSLFVIIKKDVGKKVKSSTGYNRFEFTTLSTMNSSWNVMFDKTYGGPVESQEFKTLADWTVNSNDSVKYYSGTAIYSTTFNWNALAVSNRIWLDVGVVNNIAQIKVNGVNCGVAWTAPYRVDITKALKVGVNKLEIEVTNTWANRLIGDHSLPEAERVTNTESPYRLEGKPLIPAGLLGPVVLLKEK
ncbi:glycosyl hydrolase [Pinibacter soli]|uniref:Glycosyl hydrolase n=1 Tax=Pinibacter soli TaxID=3044211 RepID=A0ABT6RF07_9BACT|nr:glycosyl hydrolase [Pinibacter soli]MDI3321161.1 glycosyl hydrolase [Pinibacter soli]